ncbi:Acyltransferase 3 (fragment) [Xenorhabdus poinarii G6]|uniref:Acyltransferase 3 n=2 Tax=Xenorhabdus poinarii TaxID=40577 RepID=A0A068R8C2_9GAMM
MILGFVNFSNLDIWLPNLFLVHSWFSQMSVFVSVNPPSWSLCSELLFYALFPLLLKPVLNIKTQHLWMSFFLSFIGLIAYQFFVDDFVPAIPKLELWPLSENQWWLSYNYPPGRLFEFIIGMILSRIAIEGLWKNASVKIAIIAAVIGYMLALYAPFQYGLNVTTIISIAVIILILTKMDLSGEKNFLSSNVMILLGEISFAFYMVHYLVLVFIKKHFIHSSLDFISSMVMLLISLMVSILLAWLIYVFVEKPVMKFAKQKITNNKPLLGDM